MRSFEMKQVHYLPWNAVLYLDSQHGTWNKHPHFPGPFETRNTRVIIQFLIVLWRPAFSAKRLDKQPRSGGGVQALEAGEAKRYWARELSFAWFNGNENAPKACLRAKIRGILVVNFIFPVCGEDNVTSSLPPPKVVACSTSGN